MRGRKPTKRQRSHGSPEATSAVVTALGPGSTSTGSTRGQALAHEREAGIGHERRAGIGDERDELPPRMRATSSPARAPFVVLVQADKRCRDAVALQQHVCVARVLARDRVGAAQRVEHAQRHVLQVADRRRADEQPAAGASAGVIPQI